MAFYTINNRCLEFDNKLIATSAEPVVIHDWYARTGFNSYVALRNYLYNTYHYDLGTPHTTYSARVAARTVQYSEEEVRFEINTHNTPFDIGPNMLVYTKSLMPIRIEDDNSFNDLTIIMDSLTSKVYDTFSGNVSDYPYANYNIALFQTYSSNPINLYNSNHRNRIVAFSTYTITGHDDFYEIINNDTDLFYSANDQHGYFPDVSADASDTYFPLEKEYVDIQMDINTTNSAVSGEILYNLNNTVYTGNMWLNDIVPQGDNKLTFAFDNAVFPSATDPNGVMFFN